MLQEKSVEHSYVGISESCCYISSGGLEFILDPSCSASRSPDAVLLSSARQICSRGFSEFYFSGSELLYYSSPMTKRMLQKETTRFARHFGRTGAKPCDAEMIIDMAFCRRTVIKRGAVSSGEVFFYPCGSFPGMSAIYIKTADNTILYTCGALPQEKELPYADTLIVRCAGGAFVGPSLAASGNGAVEIGSFSEIFDVLAYFRCTNQTVGIDRSVLEPACEYLKMGYPVFSKNIRPLSGCSSDPEIIISADCRTYPHRIKIPSGLFIPPVPLSKVYSYCRSSGAQRAYVISPYMRSEMPSRRGNIIFCGMGVYRI